MLRVQCEIVGATRIPPGPVVLVPLHEGFFDVPMLMRLGRSLRFIARDELAEWPHLENAIRSGGHIVVPTRGDLRRVVEKDRDVIDSGHDLVVFPQGSVLGIEVEFTHGGRRIAARAGVPIVPIVITGTHRVWEHPFSNRLRRDQRFHVEVFDPIHPDDVDWSASQRRMKRSALAAAAPARRYVPTRDGYWDGYAFEIDDDSPAAQEAVEAHRAELAEGPSSRRLN